MGRFVLRTALLAGVWELELDREMISPMEILIPENRDEIDIEIRVRSLDHKNVIQGHIFDEDRMPIPGAHVACYPRIVSGRFGFQDRSYSQKDGSFQILRRKTDTGLPVRLRIDKEGFNPLNPKEPIPWGTSGLRLVMIRGTGLSIRALDAETRIPVENYGIKIRSLGGRGTQMGVQRGGKHKDGILRIPGMARGRYKILVVPEESNPEKSHLASQWKEVEVTTMEGPPLLVELHQAVEQKLLVITARGKPIVGTKVELLEAYQGHPIDANTFIQTDNHTTTSANRARLWKKGLTDDTGTLWLSGPPARELGLRILGPGHVPLSKNGIRLQQSAGVITVTVKTGASIVGRIRPMAALRALDSLGLNVSKTFLDQFGLTSKAGLKLSRKSPPASYPSGYGRRFPIGENGSFRIADIAPGNWTLQLGACVTGGVEFSRV